MLYGYRKLHSPCKNRWDLQIHAIDIETRFDTSNFQLDRTLPKGKNKKGTRLMKDKKAKGTKKCVIKRKLKFQDYKNSLEEAQTETEMNHLEKYKIDVDSLKEFIKNNKLILEI